MCCRPRRGCGRAFKMVKTGELWRDISISFLRVMKGFAIAFLFAFVLGMFRALFPGSSVYYEYISAVFPQCPAAQHDSAADSLVRNRRDDEDGDYCAGVLFPMYLNIVKGFYRVRFETSGSGRYVRLFEAPQIFPHHSALCDGRYSGRNADRAWL